MEPQSINLSSQSQQIIKYLINSAQSPHAEFRQQARNHLINLAKNNIDQILKIIAYIVSTSARQPVNNYMGITYYHIGLLSLCFLKDLIYNREIKFKRDLSSMLTDLYKEIYTINHRFIQAILDCLHIYLNAPGNLRIKKEYITNLLTYLKQYYPRGLNQHDLRIMSFVFNGIQKSAPITLPSMVYPISQQFVRIYYKNPPQNINPKLWSQLILGLIKLSRISPSLELIIKGILSQNIEIRNECDVGIYLNYLKLYSSHFGSACIQSDKKILSNIITKINLGLTNVIDQNMNGIENIQCILEALSSSFYKCMCEILDARQKGNSQQYQELTTHNFFLNMVILITNLISNEEIEQSLVINNKTVRDSISRIIQSMFEVMGEESARQWVQKFFFEYSQDNNCDQKKRLLIFLSFLNTPQLENVQATDFLNREMEIYAFEFNNLITSNPDLIICFLGFMEHYIDTYKLIGQELLGKMNNFAGGVMTVGYDALQGSSIDKLSVIKSYAIAIECKLQIAFGKSSDQISIFFTDCIWETSNILKHYSKSQLNNELIILDKVKVGIKSLILINQYREAINRKSFDFLNHLMQQILDNKKDPSYLQKIAQLAIQILHLTNQTFEAEYFQQKIIIDFINRYFTIFVATRHHASLDETVLELTQKILYELNANYSEQSLALSQTTEQIISPQQNPIDMNQALIGLSVVLDYILQPNKFEYSDEKTLKLYTQIILQFTIHPNFPNQISDKLMSIYHFLKDKPVSKEIFTISDIIWEALVIQYGWVEGLEAFDNLQFHDRISQIREWDLQKIFANLDIDPNEKKQYMETDRKSSELKYKWSKLPQVKRVVHFGSIVNEVVDRKLKELS